MLYPLKFEPIFKERIWGGHKLNTYCNNPNVSNAPIGECWALSGLSGNESVVANGFLAGKTLNEVLSIYKAELVGEAVYAKFQNEFPLLFKFIDANDKLSIQVHPNDEVALKRHNCFGKTEMWYVIDAEPDAEIILGFNRKLDKETYLHHLNTGTLEEILNKVKVKAGDVFYIPAGLVHAIGKGILLAEVQQSSDITYRLYDYNRVDAFGNPRQLHTEEALDVIDFTNPVYSKVTYQRQFNQTVPLAECEYFTTTLLCFDNEITRDYSDLDFFVMLMCLSGGFEIEWKGGREFVMKGETVLVPAGMGVEIFSIKSSKILEIIIS